MSLADRLHLCAKQCPTLAPEVQESDLALLDAILAEQEPTENPYIAPKNEHAPSRKETAKRSARYALQQFYHHPRAYGREERETLIHDACTLLTIADAHEEHARVTYLVDALYALAVERDIRAFDLRTQEIGLASATKEQYGNALPEVQNYMLDKFR